MTAIHAYKMLIQDIAERLGPEDINSITFQESLPDSAKGFSSLSLLRQLEREGLFSPGNIRPLADLLGRIHRHDLVNNYVEVYLSHFGMCLLRPSYTTLFVCLYVCNGFFLILHIYIVWDVMHACSSCPLTKHF